MRHPLVSPKYYDSRETLRYLENIILIVRVIPDILSFYTSCSRLKVDFFAPQNLPQKNANSFTKNFWKCSAFYYFYYLKNGTKFIYIAWIQKSYNQKCANCQFFWDRLYYILRYWRFFKVINVINFIISLKWSLSFFKTNTCLFPKLN